MSISSLKKNFSFTKKDCFLIFFSIVWSTFNVYFLPFVIWTLGVTRPWLILNGFTAYKDFTWIRTPFDIYLLSFWYKLFGVGGISYQSFVFILLVSLSFVVLITFKLLFSSKYAIPFILFNLFLYLFFINTEEGEIIIALLNTLILLLSFLFFKTKKRKWLFLTGLVGGLIYITKQNSFLVSLALPAALVVEDFLKEERLKLLLNKISVYLFGVFIPILFLTSFFFFKNSLSDYIYYTVIFIFKGYIPASVNHGDGWLIALAFTALVVPFVLFWKKTKLRPVEVVFLIILFLVSMLSLLPSFLSYRVLPSLAITMIILGYDLRFIEEKSTKVKTVCYLSFVLFFVFTWNFIQQYFSFVQQNQIKRGQFITDYGENEYKVAEWIKRNTSKNEKILNYDTEMVYFLSNRFPINKYIEPFPYLLKPYDKTSKIFIKNPPRIIVYDNSLTSIHIGFDEWPFLKFMNKNYKKVKTFGDTIEIYRYR